MAGYDTRNDEDKQFCGKSWAEEYNSLCIDRSRKRDQRRYWVFSENKNTYINVLQKQRLFN